MGIRNQFKLLLKPIICNPLPNKTFVNLKLKTFDKTYIFFNVGERSTIQNNDVQVSSNCTIDLDNYGLPLRFQTIVHFKNGLRFKFQ